MLTSLKFPLAISCIILGSVLLISHPASAQDENKKQILESSLSTNDGWRIAVTYYQSDMGEDAPVIILVHGAKGSRLVWKSGLAKKLHDNGYAVVALDLRKHGESVFGSGIPKPKNSKGSSKSNTTRLSKADFNGMVFEDLEAVKSFLLKEHAAKRLNIRKLGFVGSDMSAVLVLNYALLDWLKKPYPDAPTLAASTPRGQDVRAIALLSPLDHVTGMPAGKAVLSLRAPEFNIAFLLCHGEKDTKSKKSVRKIHQQLMAIKQNADRVYLKTYPKNKFHGTDLLSDSKVQLLLLGFLNKHLSSLNDPWRTRKSRLQN